jgi:hypothetical protein
MDSYTLLGHSGRIAGSVKEEKAINRVSPRPSAFRVSRQSLEAEEISP